MHDDDDLRGLEALVGEVFDDLDVEPGTLDVPLDLLALDGGVMTVTTEYGEHSGVLAIVPAAFRALGRATGDRWPADAAGHGGP